MVYSFDPYHIYIFTFSYVRIIVIKLQDGSMPDPPHRYTSDKISTVNESVSTLVPYVTAQLTIDDANERKTFVIGDGFNYGQSSRRRREAVEFTTGYDESGEQGKRDRRSDDSSKAMLFYNRPLEADSSYSAFQRTFKDEVEFLGAQETMV